MGEYARTVSSYLVFFFARVITAGMVKVTSSYVFNRWSGTDCSSDDTSRDLNRRGSFLSPSFSPSSPLALSSLESSAKVKLEVSGNER